MGIAQRQIAIKYAQKSRKEKRLKPLADSIKTIGDWIQAKRKEKNMTSGHVAAKMGIAKVVVHSWEAGNSQPDSQHLSALAKIWGCVPSSMACNRFFASPSTTPEDAIFTKAKKQ